MSKFNYHDTEAPIIDQIRESGLTQITVTLTEWQAILDHPQVRDPKLSRIDRRWESDTPGEKLSFQAVLTALPEVFFTVEA
jgi:hypothetical protein